MDGKPCVIVDDTIVKLLFQKDSTKKEHISLIIDYFQYYSIKMETIKEVLGKYVSAGDNTPGKLFLDNILVGWGSIHFPEIEDWSEDECILTLANTSCTLSERVWLLSEKDFVRIPTKEGGYLVPHKRIECWKIEELVRKIKSDNKFMLYRDSLISEEKE